MNMIQKRYLIGGSGELAIIIITLLEITHLMAKFGVYEVKTIYTMIIIVFVLTVVFVHCNVQLLLIKFFCFIKNKANLKKSIDINKIKDTIITPSNTNTILTNINTILTNTNTILTNTPLMDTTLMDTTLMDTTLMDTTLMDTHTNTTPMNAILINTTPTDTIDNINNTCINAKNKENKFDIAEKYIMEAFTGCCSEEGKKNICAVMKAYSNGETDFSNYPSVSILESKYKDSEYKILKPLDLYHFGWNIWNHFRVGEQDVIAKLLKTIFKEKFPNTSIKTIKSHLKYEEKKGRITIKEDLSKPNEQKK